MSKVCKEHNFVRPTLTRDKVISIEQGRHPLVASNCDTFVPNDAESSSEEGFVKILTGPNSSGKSVYLKQIGELIRLVYFSALSPSLSF
jgi:DNA mismatch repair ATPase MutS